ncbi:MAG: hypothetical protein ACKOAD_03410 [Gammaproteobacteria bacterium]
MQLRPILKILIIKVQVLDLKNILRRSVDKKTEAVIMTKLADEKRQERRGW